MLSVGRRAFLRQAVWLSAQAVVESALLTGTFSVAIAQNSFAERAKVVDAWMNEWMKRDKDVVGALHLGRFADPMYFLLKPITWKPNADQTGYSAVTVPVGFVTDLASVPRLFWSIFRPDGLYTYPAIVHDYLYWTQNISKDAADNIFQFSMQDIGVDRVTTTALYQAVHLAGQSAWNENTHLKSLGEKRMLSILPDDPRTRWDEWKKAPGHFY
jgi:hypothetical protein